MMGTMPFTKEMMAHTQEDKEDQRIATSRLIAEITAAVEMGDKEFVIKPGYYRFGREHAKQLLLSGVKNFSIKSEGAHFIQEAPTTLIELKGCRNLSISGITLDFDPVPYIQGTVTNVDKINKRIEFVLDEEKSTIVYLLI